MRLLHSEHSNMLQTYFYNVNYPLKEDSSLGHVPKSGVPLYFSSLYIHAVLQCSLSPQLPCGNGWHHIRLPVCNQSHQPGFPTIGDKEACLLLPSQSDQVGYVVNTINSSICTKVC